MTGRQDDRQEYDRQRILDKYMIDVFPAVVRIRDILDPDPWIRTLDYESGSCSFWQLLSRCQTKFVFLLIS
jgi:hypothetical protein